MLSNLMWENPDLKQERNEYNERDAARKRQLERAYALERQVHAEKRVVLQQQQQWEPPPPISSPLEAYDIMRTQPQMSQRYVEAAQYLVLNENNMVAAQFLLAKGHATELELKNFFATKGIAI